MKIYFDFDGTLFNNTKFYNDLVNVFVNHGVTKEQVVSVQKELFKDSCFNLRRLANKLIDVYKLSPKVLEEALNLYNNNYVYEDCIPFLEKALKHFECILLTCGDNDYQFEKIACSNLAHYFKSIVITDYNKSGLDLDYVNNIFIDNNVNELDKFKSVGAQFLYQIRRIGDSHYDDVGNYEEIDLLNDTLLQKLILVKNMFE